MNAIAHKLTAKLSADTTTARRTVPASTGAGVSSLLTDSYPPLGIASPLRTRLRAHAHPDRLEASLATRKVGGRKALARAANLHHGAQALAVH